MKPATEIRILHVDDDKDFLELAKTILSEEGPFNVEIAASTKEALNKLQGNCFDIIISDFDMPQQNGLEFFKLIREKGFTTPFILFTGKGREEIAVQALNLGIDRYINKHDNPQTVYTELSVSINQLFDKTQAKKRLWESEERFKQMVTNSKDLIMLTGVDGAILYLSPSCRDILGYEPEELVGKVPWIIHSDDLERVHKIFQSALTTQVSGNVEYRVVTKQGETKWVNHSYSQIVENGKIKQIVSTVKDVTENKNAQAKLLESEQRLRLVVENSPIMMANLNLELQYTWVHNPLLRPQLSEQILGKHFGEQTNIDNVEKIKRELEEIIKKGGALRTETSVHDNHGTLFLDCYFEAAKNSQGEVTGIRYTAYDITQRKEIEKQLKSSEERWNFALEGAEHGVWDINPEANTVFLSKRWKKILGYEENEIKNEVSEWQNHLHPNDKQKAIQNIEEFIAGKKPCYSAEYRLLAKDGSYKWVSSQGKIITLNPEGKPLRIIGTIFDITRQRNAENALRESEAKFSAAFNSSGAALVISRFEDGLILEVNDCFLSIFGYNREEVIGNTSQELNLFADFNERKNLVNLTLNNQAVINQEVRGFRKDQTEVTALFSTKIFVVKGQRHLLTTLIDISELKKAEKALFLRTRQLENFFAMAPDSVIILDLTGKIVECNELSWKTFGLTREEVIGTYGADFVVEKDRKRLEQELLGAMNDKQVHTSIFTGKHRNGDERSLEGSVQAIFDQQGKPTAFITIIRDITARVLTEKKLQESEERYRFVAEHAQDLITVTNKNGLFHYVSPSIRHLTGFEPGDLVGKKGAFELVHVEDQQLVRDTSKRLLESKEVAPIEIRFKTKDDSYIWIETNISTVKDVNGKNKFIGISRDVTQRRIDREERAKALEWAELLLKKLSVVGGFVRHDVRNKLAVITGTVYLCKKYAKANCNQFMLEHIEQIEQTVKSIEHILEFSQTYEAAGSQGLSWYPINNAVKEAKNLSPNIDNIAFSAENVDFEVLADSAIVEIFHNLLDNSMKYGKNLSQIKIFSQITQNGNMELIYEDNGGGIDPQIKPHLFQKGAGKGTGLGLYLIQRICEIYDWQISEKGKQGEGVIFVLELPSLKIRKTTS